MTEANAHLFVYGTLLSRDSGAGGRAQRDRLARESRVIAAATVRGRLYHLGRYPGLVSGGGPGDVVHGEVLALTMPDITLAWLDDYEGIVAGDHTHNEYARVTIDVALDSGERVSAWTYVYRQPVVDKPLIATGSWLDRG